MVLLGGFDDEPGIRERSRICAARCARLSRPD